jgi:hypothetical protein
MASIRKQKSGAWRVQVRRKGHSLSETFVSHEDAKRWAVDTERQIDRGHAPTKSRIARVRTFGDLIDLHIADMKAARGLNGLHRTVLSLPRSKPPHKRFSLSRQGVSPINGEVGVWAAEDKVEGSQQRSTRQAILEQGRR